jgi:hypothetical protein
MFIPNQIDANLIPFSGFTYVGKFNPFNYRNNISDDLKEDILEVNELNNKIRNLLKNSLINRIDYNKRRKQRLKKEKEHFETVRQIILKSGSIYD